jgi:CheY-like chemotaxis protein
LTEPYRALLIEDNENNRYLLTLLLQNAGITVLIAPNGKIGLERARADRPDIILLDIQMPDMDGYEVIAEIRRDPSLSSIPVLGVSSFAMPGDKDLALKRGFTGYVEKPVDPEHFASEVSRLLVPRPPA